MFFQARAVKQSISPPGRSGMHQDAVAFTLQTSECSLSDQVTRRLRDTLMGVSIDPRQPDYKLDPFGLCLFDSMTVTM